MPKKKSSSIPHLLISSEQGLESAINSYVDASLGLLRKKAKQEKSIAELKTQHDAENGALETEVLSLETGIQLFCTTHREIFGAEKKSKEYGNATVGFRLNPHCVDKLLSKDTWERIAERLDGLPWGEPFVQTKLSVDKSMLLKCRAEITDGQMAEAGLCFAQAETFFLEPHSDLLDAARKPAESEAAA